MSKKLEIRRACNADIDGLLDLLDQLFCIESSFEFNEEKQKRALALLISDSETCSLMVAQYGEEIVGMASVQTLVSTAEGGRVGLIEDLVVTQRYRGRGFGSQLLEAIEKWALSRGLLRLQLLADRANRDALGFYYQKEWKFTGMLGLRKPLAAFSARTIVE